MSIAREGDFLLNHEGPFGTTLGLESSRLASCISEVHKRGYRGVFGCPHFGFREADLDSIAELPPIQTMRFWDVTLTSAKGIYAQPTLQHLGVNPKRPGIDFIRLPALESLVLHYNSKDTGLEQLRQLRALYLWHHNTKSRSFRGLALPAGLSHLDITWSNPPSIEGLPELPELRSFEMHRCRNLESLEALPRIAPNLEKLVITTCGRISEAEAERVVSRLPRLKHAFVQHRVYVTDRNAV